LLIISQSQFCGISGNPYKSAETVFGRLAPPGDQKKWRIPISIVDFTPKRLSVPDMPVPGRI
jgi:hypothetical protein